MHADLMVYNTCLRPAAQFLQGSSIKHACKPPESLAVIDIVRLVACNRRRQENIGSVVFELDNVSAGDGVVPGRASLGQGGGEDGWDDQQCSD